MFSKVQNIPHVIDANGSHSLVDLQFLQFLHI
jgi:hypothetical protein